VAIAASLSRCLRAEKLGYGAAGCPLGSIAAIITFPAHLAPLDRVADTGFPLKGAYPLIGYVLLVLSALTVGLPFLWES